MAPTVGEYCPAAHGTHAPADSAAPTVVENVPTAHPTQSGWPLDGW